MSAYLNALREEGTRDDLLKEIERLAKERDEARRHIQHLCDMIAPTVKAESRLPQGLSSALGLARRFLEKD